MGLKYAAIHVFIHFLTSIALAYVFGLNLIQFLVAFIGAFIIDIDHLFLLKRYGIKGAFSKVILHGFGKIRKYPLHNYLVFILVVALALLVYQAGFFLIGIFSLAVFLHLLWDLLEDAVIFRVKLNHWKV